MFRKKSRYVRTTPRKGIVSVGAVLNKAIAKNAEKDIKDDLVDDLAKRFSAQNIIFNEIDKEMQKARMPIPVTSLPVDNKSEEKVEKEIRDELKANL